MDWTTESPILIGGASRSGTTLMRVLLDSHPDICCGPELKMLALIGRLWDQVGSSAAYDILGEYGMDGPAINGAFADFAYAFVRRFREKRGARRWAEKTPNNIDLLDFLFSIFPNTRFVHLIRDGRDVCCSLVGKDWTDLRTGEPVAYTRDVRTAALYWKTTIVRARQWLAANPRAQKRYAEVRYEQLVQHTEPVLRQLMAFVGEPFDERMLSHHEQQHDFNAFEESTGQVQQPVHSRALGRWKRDMSEDDRAIFKEVAGDLLLALGYEEDPGW